MSFLNELSAGLLSVLYPPACLGCRQHTDRPEIPLCPTCLDTLEPVREGQITNVLRRLPIDDFGIDGGWAQWIFEKNSPLQHLMHTFKYGNRPRIGINLGRRLGHLCAEMWSRDSRPQPDLLLPIPLYRTRYLERGYNQSAKIVEGMRSVLQISALNEGLIRSRNTRSQTNLSRIERWNNVQHAFSVTDPSPVADRSILLVDDVLTTGSTLAAAALELRSAGAESVRVATIAMARRYEK